MADDPSAAELERQSRTSRTGDATRRRATARWRTAIAVGLIALLAGGAFLLFRGEGPAIEGGKLGPGEFSFDLKNVKASPISDTLAADLRDEAEEAAAGIKATMDELYFRGYVDTGSWGDYSVVYDLFEGKAAARAETDTDILTLGGTANDVYDSLTPTLGTLTIAVLTNGEDVPVTAIAQVDFAAEAELKDGSATNVASSGSFFLRSVGDEWRIFAYQLVRDEEAAEEPSPTEEAS